MKRNILIVTLLLAILSGCGRKNLPLQRFEGETVATLQISLDEEADGYLTTTPTNPQSTQETTLPTTTAPVDPLGDEAQATSTLPVIVGTSYPAQVSTPPPALALTGGPTLTATPTLANPVWTGKWNIWFQDKTGDYIKAVMTVTLSGNQLTANTTLKNNDYLFTGTLLTEAAKVEGKWFTGSDEGKFWWQMIAADTFAGSWDGRFGFCGDRESEEQPTACRRIP